MSALEPPVEGDDWIDLTAHDLPAGAAADWVVRPRCGAVVLFSGTSRDHSGAPGTAEERVGVTSLEYEAYDSEVVPRLRTVAAELRRRWPMVGAVCLLHRCGVVPVGSSSVVVAVSAPHRNEAFEAARFGIDAVKASVPIWKREVWDGGSAWGVDAHDITDLSDVADALDPVDRRVGGSRNMPAAATASGRAS